MKTELGKKLKALRNQAITKGMKLKTMEQLEVGEFKDLPEEVQEIIKSAHAIGKELDICNNDLLVRILGIDLCRQIEALWPEFGEGNE